MVLPLAAKLVLMMMAVQGKSLETEAAGLVQVQVGADGDYQRLRIEDQLAAMRKEMQQLRTEVQELRADDDLKFRSSPLPALIQNALDTLLPFIEDYIPAEILPLLQDPEAFLADPMTVINCPALAPVREQILQKIEEAVMMAVRQVPMMRRAFQQILGTNPSELPRALLECSSHTSCGNCSNNVNPCYWCAQSNSCHPIGSQQLGMEMSDSSTCTDRTCQSQFPTSTCKSAYCADGSSVGDDDGPCGGRMNCGACTQGNCFWCGISGSCHAIGSQHFDERCTEDNCQSTKWFSSCNSQLTCDDATPYQPLED